MQIDASSQLDFKYDFAHKMNSSFAASSPHTDLNVMSLKICYVQFCFHIIILISHNSPFFLNHKTVGDCGRCHEINQKKNIEN